MPIGRWICAMTVESQARVTLVNKWGLHARASFRLASMAMTYESRIIVEKEGSAADAKKMDELLLLIAQAGDTLMIKAIGPDGPEAVENLASLIQSGFAEG